MNFNVEALAHLVEIGTFLLIGVKGLRKLDRFYALFEDNPPHRHLNGKIIYPKGYEPPVVENLDGRGTS
jgi:hypothetical protein